MRNMNGKVLTEEQKSEQARSFQVFGCYTAGPCGKCGQGELTAGANGKVDKKCHFCK